MHLEHRLQAGRPSVPFNTGSGKSAKGQEAFPQKASFGSHCRLVCGLWMDAVLTPLDFYAFCLLCFIIYLAWLMSLLTSCYEIWNRYNNVFLINIWLKKRVSYLLAMPHTHQQIGKNSFQLLCEYEFRGINKCKLKKSEAYDCYSLFILESQNNTWICDCIDRKKQMFILSWSTQSSDQLFKRTKAIRGAVIQKSLQGITVRQFLHHIKWLE